MSFVSLAVLKQVLDTALSVNDLVGVICGTAYSEALEAIVDVNVESGISLLREASHLSDEARRDKLLLAISALETGYRALVRQAKAPSWKTPFSPNAKQRAIKRACLVSLALVTAYSWRGVDPASVREREAASRDSLSQWEKLVKDRIAFIEAEIRAGNFVSEVSLGVWAPSAAEECRRLSGELDYMRTLTCRVLRICLGSMESRPA